MEFSVHGEFTFLFVEEILVVKVVGSWNRECAIRFDRAFRTVASDLDSQPWGNVLDMSQWKLATPDIWIEIKETALWLAEHNHRFEAVVINNMLEQHLMVERFKLTPKLRTAFFNNETQAIDWCKAQDQKRHSA